MICGCGHGSDLIIDLVETRESMASRVRWPVKLHSQTPLGYQLRQSRLAIL